MAVHDRVGISDIQPVFLEAKTRNQIPELQRAIMTEGRIAVMEKSLEDAYQHLRFRVSRLNQRVRSRFPTSEGEGLQEEGP